MINIFLGSKLKDIINLSIERTALILIFIPVTQIFWYLGTGFSYL